MHPSRAVRLVALIVPAVSAQAPPPAPAGLALKGVIRVGDVVHDSLTRRDRRLVAESTYAQAWRLRGSAGETLTIDLVSAAFDAYLFLLGPGFEGTPPQDDDSGGNCNARLTVRLPQSGDYQIVVTSTDNLATGPYTLTVTAGAKPKALRPCLR